MYCQLDQVGSILEMVNTVQDTLTDQLPGDTDITDFSLAAGAMIYGLLLLNHHDVFLKQGQMNLPGTTRQAHWVELFMDGELFIIAAAPGPQSKSWDIVLMLEDEARGLYGFHDAQDAAWQQQFCAPDLWQPLLQKLDVAAPAQEVLQQIAAESDF